ncbi:reverse transcriptase domain-containing protein [Tanacetum coccineum]
MHLAVHNIKQREGESTRAFVTRNLVEFLSTDLPTTYKGLMEKTYTWIKAREVENNGALNDRREGFEKSRKNPSWDNKKGHKNRDRDNRALKRKSVEESVDGVREITFLPFLSINSSDLVIIKAQISRRLMSRVYMDSGSSCEVIYEHCFLKLKLSIGTAMQRMGIIVYTIYEAIKFHTPRGIGTIFLTRKFDKARKEQKKLKGTPQKATKDILNCVDTKERIVVNEEYSKQTITWVSNPVMVKKEDGRWKLCVDFTDINKACLKDHYSLLAIDQKVEILSKFWLKCFLDAYKGYHQIHMAERDKEKDSLLHKRKRRNLEFHVDDIVIKSESEEDMLVDIKETFDKLRAINMKLNPSKCSFGVEEGPFLGHLITKQGIKDNPSKGANKTLPFLKTLKNYTKGKIVQWTTEVDEAFQNMKKFIETLPTVTSSIEGETLVLYLAASEGSISVVLLVERGKKQVTVYFVSRALQGAELEYLELEKLILALIHAARRLRRYFQAHPIPIITDKPIKQILARPEKSGHIAKWVIKLGEHEIEFRGRNSVKGQILADFLGKTPFAEDREMEVEETKGKGPGPENAWKLFINRALSSDGSGSGLMLVRLEGKEYTYAHLCS